MTYWDEPSRPAGAPSRGERELQVARDRLRLALDAARLGVWDWDIATGDVRWEGRLEEVHGMAPGTFDGTLACVMRAIEEEDRARVEQEIARAAARRAQDLRIDFRTRGADGRVRWVAYEGRVVCDAGGRPVRVVGVGRDVSLERRAQEALAEGEARFRLLADSAPVLIWISDAAGGCVYVNRPWLEFTGRAMEQELGAGWVEGVHPEDLRRFLGVYRAALAVHEPFEVEYRLRRRDGRYRWVLDRGVPRFGDAGFAGYIGSAIDIDERHRAERRQALLSRVLAALDTVSLDARLEALAGVLVPALADGCLIRVADRGRGRPRAAVARHHDPAKEELLRELATAGGIAALAGSGAEAPVLLGELDEARAGDDALRALGARSAAVVPLTARGIRIGTLELITGREESGRALSEEDLALGEEIAGRAALAIDNVRLFEDERAAAERLDFLAEASRLLASSLEHEQTLRALADLAVPRLADWCVVDLIEDGQLTGVAIAHADPARARLAAELRNRYPPDPASELGPPAVVRTGRAQLVEEISDGMLRRAARDPAHLSLLRGLGLRGFVCVPLEARGRVLGALTLVRQDSERPVGQEDLTLAEELGRRAATAIDHARLYEGQRHVARTLQEALLPPEVPEVPGVEAASAYIPHGEGIEAGGDFYDLFEAAPGRWCVTIGDVCGKGPAAAAFTSLARYTMRALSRAHEYPADLAVALNAEIRRQVGRTTRFLTGCIGMLRPDGEGATVSLACAGHPDPLVLRGDGRMEWVPGTGDLIGVFDQITVGRRTVRLRSGDRLLLYTDGVTEARAGGRLFEREGLERAAAAASSRDAAGLVDAVVSALRGFSPAPLRDDVALLCLRAR